MRDIGRALTLEGSRDPEFVRTTSTVFPILIDTIKTGSPVFKRLVNDKENAEQVPYSAQNGEWHGPDLHIIGSSSADTGGTS